MEILLLALFFIAAFASSFVGALVGGGSLIITSVLLAAGIPPLQVLGSRRVAAIGGNLGSWIRYHRQKKVDYRLVLILVVPSLIGVLLGFWLIEYFKELDLRLLMGIFLLALLCVHVVREVQGDRIRRFHSRTVQHALGVFGAIVASFVNNIAAAGGGMLLAYTLLLVYGKSILNTAGTSKFLLVIANSFAAVLFIAGDYVDFELVAVMIVGHFLGGLLGAHFYIKQSKPVLRILLYGVVILMIIRILFI